MRLHITPDCGHHTGLWASHQTAGITPDCGYHTGLLVSHRSVGITPDYRHHTGLRVSHRTAGITTDCWYHTGLRVSHRTMGIKTFLYLGQISYLMPASSTPSKSRFKLHYFSYTIVSLMIFLCGSLWATDNVELFVWLFFIKIQPFAGRCLSPCIGRALHKVFYTARKYRFGDDIKKHTTTVSVESKSVQIFI